MPKKIDFWIRRKICPICKQDKWLRVKFSGRYFLLMGSSDTRMIFENNTSNTLIGFGIGNDETEYCMSCFEILVKMENYFDMFYSDMVKHIPAIQAVRGFVKSQSIRDKCYQWIKKKENQGNYLPINIIREMILEGGGELSTTIPPIKR